jgi:hypothetical protein
MKAELDMAAVAELDFKLVPAIVMSEATRLFD